MRKPVKYNDYPLVECAQTARALILQGMDVYQKWTCGHCGSRQTMEDKNLFYASGSCEECRGVTVIEKCNYLVHAQGTQAHILFEDLRHDKET